MKKLKITTSQIAKICGVSQGTVDRALNNRPDISAETKQKVLNVAKNYGYREYFDEDFDKVRGQVGIIVFNLNNEYISELITEIEFALRLDGLTPLIMMTHYDSQREIECIRNLYNVGVEGILLCSVNSGTEFENYLSLFDIPIVMIGNRVGDQPYVGVDDALAMRDMTKEILSRNPEHLIYFSPALKYNNSMAQRRRYDGFLKAVGDRSYEVYSDISEIREQYEKPTAVICSTDYYALQVYFKSKNVTVSGFDNIRILERYRIAIDSLGYSIPQIAISALKLLKSGERKAVIIPHYIVKRT